MLVTEGSIIAERYRVERIIGQGGMGMVVAAVHVGLDERVAIKLLLPDDRDDGLDVARFLREARISAKIRSEHVARVSDVGTLEDGTPFLVMEHLVGHDLAHHLRERGRLSVGDAVDYVLQACEGLAEAHSLGVIHRDLKPSNLFLSRRRDGTALIKVLDFGVSKLMTPGAAGALTRTTDVVGSPLYMPPEQMLSAKHVDVRSDQWAIGVILYEMLVGDVPWTADTLAALCAQILEMDPPPIVPVRPEVPLGLQRVIFRCLARNPSDRYAHLGELARALEPFAPPHARACVSRIVGTVGLGAETQRGGADGAATDLDPPPRTGAETIPGTAPPTEQERAPMDATLASPAGLASPGLFHASGATPAIELATPRPHTARSATTPAARPRAPSPAPREDAPSSARAAVVAVVAFVLLAAGIGTLWALRSPEAPPAADPATASRPAATPATPSVSVSVAAPAPSTSASAALPRKAPSGQPRPRPPTDPGTDDFGSRH